MNQVTTNHDQEEHTVTIITGVSSRRTKKQNEESTPRLQFNNNSVIHEKEAGRSPFTMYQYWPILSHPLFVKLDSEGKITNMTMVNKLANNNDNAKLSLFNKKYNERAVCCFVIMLKRVRTGDDFFASRWPVWLFIACVVSNPDPVSWLLGFR